MDHPATFVLRCTQCRVPLLAERGKTERCLCLPQAFTCNECHEVFPFPLSRFKKLSRGQSTPSEWTRAEVSFTRKYLCPTCRARERERKRYRTIKQEAGKQIYAERRRMNAHPLHKWARYAKQYAYTVRYQMPDRPRHQHEYYELLARTLSEYAERIEAALAANPNLDYPREGKGGYPDELKPSTKQIYERLPRVERGLLYEMASHLGLKRHRTVWGTINKANP